MTPLATTPEVLALLAAGAPVGLSVSGGKDSIAAALAVTDYLDAQGHHGPRALFHADLGRDDGMEWADSWPTCQRLAARLGLPLVETRHARFDMLGRWRYRWTCNVDRYRSLSCVKLIKPWSGPGLERFCTSEMKTAPLGRAMRARWPGQTILSVCGIRRDESRARAGAAVAAPAPALTALRQGTRGLLWQPLVAWSAQDVYTCVHAHGFALHEAYTRFGAPRVSCTGCVLASTEGIVAAGRDARNWPGLRHQMDLELQSTFPFKQGRWLVALLPHVASPTQGAALPRAQAAQRAREEAEALIPPHLLYTAGWPTCLPTPAEADLLAAVRRAVARAVGLEDMTCTTEAAVLARYTALLAAKEAAA